MKVNFDRASFLDSFSLVAGIAPTRTPKEILQNVLLTVTDSHATLRACDGEVEMQATISDGIEVEAGGSVVIPVQRGLSILRESTGEQVTLEESDGILLIKSKRSKFRLPLVDASLFPAFSGFQESTQIDIKTEKLIEGIGRSHFAVDTAQRSGRFSTGGLLVQSEEGRLAFVATCGRRVVSQIVDIEGGGSIDNNTTIVPHKGAKAVLSAARGSKEDLAKIYAGHSRFTADFGDVLIHARLIEGRFPDWRRLVPKHVSDNSAIVSAGDADRAIRQASICTDKESLGIKFSFSQDNLILEAKSSETGSSVVECAATYGGEADSVVLNGKMVADFCRTLDSEDEIFVSMDGLKSSNGAPMVHMASGDLSMCVAPIVG
jgi:DNA polymerase-3 subunit beta